MRGDKGHLGQRRLKEPRAGVFQSHGLAERGRGCRDAETHDDLRAQRFDLSDQPRLARLISRSCGFLCIRCLPRRLPFKMFHGVDDVYRFAIDSGRHQRLIQQSPRGPDERTS